MYAEAAFFQAGHGRLEATDKGQDGGLIGWFDHQRYLQGGWLTPWGSRLRGVRLGMVWNRHEEACGAWSMHGPSRPAPAV